MYSRIAGTGRYLPERVVTNVELARMVDASDKWIRTRTGIERRHFVADGQTTSDLAEGAAREAMAAAGVDAADIDFILVSTSTPDIVFPNAGCLLQDRLGLHGCPAFGLESESSGFIHGLSIADKFVRSEQTSCALVVGAESVSRILDWSDPASSVRQADGAGAVVLQPADTPGIVSTQLGANGVEDEQAPVKALRETLASVSLDPSDIKWLIPRQTTLPGIEATAGRHGISMDQVIVTVREYGDTGAASVPIALDIGARDGRVEAGDLLLLEASGQGSNWGTVLLRY